MDGWMENLSQDRSIDEDSMCLGWVQALSVRMQVLTGIEERHTLHTTKESPSN